jgi:acyl transferase domain-containing protein
VPITSEPLAIMGIGCRLHGDIETPDALWNALIHARDSAGT